MAKIEYVVVDGCIQCGSKIIRKNEVYVPPSAEIRELLLAEGKIVARGKINTGRTNRAPASNAPGTAQPAGQPAPLVADPDGSDDDDGDDDDDSGD